MKIHCESIAHYLAWMREGNPFSFAGYSDAEWYCVLGTKDGERTALGQQLSNRHGERLLDVLQRRQHDPRFLIAVPSCLWPHEEPRGSGKHHPGLPGFAEGQIDWFLGKHGIAVDGWERDRVTDDLARDAGLFHFINQIQSMPTCMIGPAPLKCSRPFLFWKRFVEIETPNLHLADGGIELAAERAWTWAAGRRGCLFLVSAGVSAALIIDRLHDAVPGSFCFDCGSIWDCFARIGGQRQWRAELYADDARYNKWIKDNLEGKQ